MESRSKMLTCKFCGINHNLIWYITAVYANCGRSERKVLWEEMGAMRGLCEGPWVVSCFCCDFNIRRFSIEKPIAID